MEKQQTQLANETAVLNRSIAADIRKLLKLRARLENQGAIIADAGVFNLMTVSEREASPEKDRKLIEIMSSRKLPLTVYQWRDVADQMGDVELVNVYRCRYLMHLRPGLDRSTLTMEEKRAFMKLGMKLGWNWHEMAKVKIYGKRRPLMIVMKLVKCYLYRLKLLNVTVNRLGDVDLLPDEIFSDDNAEMIPTDLDRMRHEFLQRLQARAITDQSDPREDKISGDENEQ